jgi:hypothetical protein
MTLVTIHAVVYVSTHFGVAPIRVVVAMATCALEDRVVVGVRVAGCADSVRVPVVHWEVGMVERRSGPGRRRVARGASGREARRSVIRIRRAVVIRLVTPNACRWQRCVVVVHMATCAGDGGVRPSERERRRVVIERCAGPVGGAVANVARRRETYR